MHEDLDLTDVDLLVLCLAIGIYTLEAVGNLLPKEDRMLARMLSSRAEYIEACVWEYRRRHPRYSRPAKVSSRFRHSHEDRVLPKADLKRPYAGTRWGADLECVAGTSERERKKLAHPRKEYTCRPSCGCKEYYGRERAMPEGEHIAEELMHARELDDLALVTSGVGDAAAWEHERFVDEVLECEDLTGIWSLEEHYVVHAGLGPDDAHKAASRDLVAKYKRDDERYAEAMDRRFALGLSHEPVAQAPSEDWEALMGACEDVQLRRDGLSIAHV